MDSQCEQRFVEKMKALVEGLPKKDRTKNHDKVMLAIGRLKQKYARVAQYYDINLTKAEEGPNAVSLSFERINHEAKEYAGVYCLKDHDIHDSWQTLRKAMHTHMRLTTTMRTKKGGALHIRKASRPEAWQQTIYKALGLSYNPGGTMKTIISDRE